MFLLNPGPSFKTPDMPKGLVTWLSTGRRTIGADHLSRLFPRSGDIFL